MLRKRHIDTAKVKKKETMEKKVKVTIKAKCKKKNKNVCLNAFEFISYYI